MKIIKEVALAIGRILIIALSITLISYTIFAWTGPTGEPPAENLSAPINSGTETQYKTGAFGIGGLFQTDIDTHLATESGNVGIGTTDPQVQLDVSGTGAIKIPVGDDEQRPSSPQIGMIRFSTEKQGIEYYNGNDWIGYGLKDGSSSEKAAESCLDIKALTGTTSNDFYWVNINSTPTNIWCDMTNDGGGWMLAMRVHNNTSRWYYDDAYWTNTTLLNETRGFDYSGHVKTKVYTNYPFSEVRLVAGDLSNGLIENWSGTSLSSFMGSSNASTNNRTAWISWITAAAGEDPSLQSNCNQAGTNKAYKYMYVRLGITSNGEDNCSSNDSALGFGIKGLSPYSNVNPLGAFSISGRNSLYTGAIFVR
jgi:hypothetical protein